MQQLVFATNNRNKVREIQQIVGDQYQFLTLADIGCEEDIPETSPTIQGNALQKARYVYEKYGYNCFGEDTGIEIDALDGAPGVYTARYAGEAKDDRANIALALRNLEGKDNRRAQFRTVIALIIDGKEYCFEGIATGTIAQEPSGDGGFGYDPIFVPDEGDGRTYAELPAELKNRISHRGKAVQLFLAFLKSSQG